VAATHAVPPGAPERSCTSFDDPELGEGQIGEPSFPSRGDEFAAYRIRPEPQGQASTADLIGIRRGPIVAAISYIATGFIDTDHDEEIVDRALAKIDDALTLQHSIAGR
jgi:hypothetical protein